MGLASRQYMHGWGCTCPQCREAYERYKQERELEVRIAAEKYRKDKEFGDNLRKMLGPSTRCKHSRPLADGEKWEDTFCNLLCVPCHLVKHGSCASEELIPILEESNPEVSNDKTTDIKCPTCGGKTILRTVSKGKDKGQQFYVCIAHPKCKGRIHKK